MQNQQSRLRVTSLCIGAQQTSVGTEGVDDPLILPIGFAFPGVVFRQQPPRERELELAIAAVEDVVMPLARTLPQPTRLVTSDELALRLASIAGRGSPLTIEAVEAMFNELAALAAGRPAGNSPILDASLCGYLLILREWMHHLAFAQIEVQVPAPS
jgi:hypothetical protein